MMSSTYHSVFKHWKLINKSQNCFLGSPGILRADSANVSAPIGVRAPGAEAMANTFTQIAESRSAASFDTPAMHSGANIHRPVAPNMAGL